MRSARTFGVCILFLSTWAIAQNAIPTVEQPLVPTAAQPGAAAFTLTINGAGFVKPPTAVLWGQGTNVTQLPITSSTASELTATVPAANIAAAGSSSVSVLNASGIVSNIQFFQIATPASPQFAPPVDYNSGIPGTVETTLVADFNGDGILDLAVGGLTLGNGARVSILLGNSDGTFQTPTAADIYAVTDASSIVAGRFTNGGSIDLVAGNTRLANNGSGVFTPTPLIVGGNVGFRPFAVGDFTHSATLDIAGLVGLNVQIINNNGASSFSLGQNFAAGIATAGGMLAADFDGDGFLDLAVLDISAASPAVRVFLGSAAGFSGGNGIPTATPQGGVAFTAADFNGDSEQDIAFVYNTGLSLPPAEVLILNGNGLGGFSSGSSVFLANPVSGAIVTGDFNEDGKLDLATGTYVLQGNGDGTFQAPINFGGTAQVLATGDFNGDGRPDLAAQSNPNVAVLLQQPPPAPVASLSPPSLNFSQPVGTTSASQQITLTNTGNAVLNITAIGIIGTNAAEFAQTTTCGATLAADNSCFINVTFTPTAAGTAMASISVTDNAAGSPQTVPLTGLGLSPAAMLSPSPLTFSSQLAGASATLPVTLTNGGNAPLTITSIAFTGPNASEFGQTNNCPSSLAPDNSCTINVTFTPTAGGNATASLSVTDNAPGSPQTVPITGTSQSILTTTCTSLTVVPGQTAIFTVDLAAVNEFAPTVSLSCSGAPAQATCTVSPSMVTPTGSTPVPAQVTVTTMRAFLQPPFGTSNENRMAGLVGLAGVAGFAALVVVPGRRRVKPGRRLCGLIFLLCILATLAILPSCGGTAGSDPPSTATGTYPLTVTGTFQSGGTTITEKVSFNLVVN
jgi:Abnormal spindle-like microcephaly-assoc'd, ASPM-SPD-2-Hydin/FG-GAP-like repeat